MSEKKRCGTCKKEKPLDMFYNMSNSKDGKGYRCKPCDTKARKESRARDPEGTKRGSRNRMLQSKYGITLEQYEKMLKNQGGVCRICGTDNPLGEGNTREGSRWKTWSFAVDHCHSTNEIRGLLCNNCNRGLGFFKDSRELLEKALEYLR